MENQEKHSRTYPKTRRLESLSKENDFLLFEESRMKFTAAKGKSEKRKKSYSEKRVKRNYLVLHFIVLFDQESKDLCVML
jgi:hypothetical protein